MIKQTLTRIGITALMIAALLSTLLPSLQASAAVAVPEDSSSHSTNNGPEVVESIHQNPVFGQNLFSGFRQAEFKGFNPNYQLAIGDKITLQMWGGL